MESLEAEVTLIAFIDAWYIIRLNGEVLEGPFKDHADALTRIETRAWRISQGWSP